MNRQDLQNLAEAYSQISEKKKDDSYLETDMKKRQENNEKARKDMEKMGTKMKNPHFEQYTVTNADKKGNTKAYQNFKAGMKKKDGTPMYKAADHMKEGVRDLDPEKGTAERKARLEKKRGMKMDDHPQFKKEESKVEEGIDFKGAAREQARRDKIQDEKDKKSPSSKDYRLALRKFRPGASQAERASGGRDVMREKGTQPKKDGKLMFTKESYDSMAKEYVNEVLGALATPVGAGLAGGAVGAVTGGKKKVKKSLATGTGAAAGAALGGLPGAVIGGLAGNALS